MIHSDVGFYRCTSEEEEDNKLEIGEEKDGLDLDYDKYKRDFSEKFPH